MRSSAPTMVTTNRTGTAHEQGPARPLARNAGILRSCAPLRLALSDSEVP
jgi:hypothetical protein